MKYVSLSALCALALLVSSYDSLHGQPAGPRPPIFELKSGDRVVFLGDVLMEREQLHGYIETALTLQFPDRHVTFRNLGWSGDTPQGIAREGLSLLQAGREPHDEGFKQLQQQIQLVKPTVVFLGYGMAASFGGEPALPGFVKDLNRLIDAISQASGDNRVRFVLLSPVPHENLGAPLPDAQHHNQQLAAYTRAIRQVAEERQAPFVSLFDALGALPRRGPALTENGIHLSAVGYQKAAEAIETALGLKPTAWTGSKAEAVETLRQAIVAKNEIFFHRSRPQNMAYLLGFRKHEQGKNAAEIPQFDPLIEAEEKKIAELRQLPARRSAQPPAARSTGAAPGLKPSSAAELQFEVAPGFEVNLFAEDPLLAKPIQMNFDAQGRLWVASSSVYPQIQPGQAAEDKILILEDTNRNGRADKSTVFADGLLIPTGIEPGDGGAYIGQSTELLHFRDTNGDGKADQKRIVLSGFGTEDTHHIVHTLRWGHDGQLYFNQSIYIRSHIETPHGVVRLKSGGIFHLRPSTLELEVIFRGWVNSWGHHFDRYGQSFATDGAGFQGIYYAMPGAMYFTYAGARRTLDSISPGNYPKFCGLEVISSPHFPDDWQGDMITCDFRAHRIVRFKVGDQGAGYASTEMPDLLRTANVTFRPIDAKMGPDGALYIADWSNPIIQHGEVDFRDPRRDKEHGRIWRITAKGRPLVPVPNLYKASTRELLDNLVSPNGFTREKSNRVLTERGSAITSDLKRWTSAQKTDEARLSALWLYQALDQTEPALLNQLLNATDGRIRAAATRVLSFWLPRLPQGESWLERLVQDEHPRVRVEAVRALSKLPTARSAELVLSVLDRPMDPFLDYAVWLSINDLAQPWLRAIRAGDWQIEGREKQLEFGLKAIEPSLASTVLAQLLDKRPLKRDGRGPWIELIGQSGGPSELRLLLEKVVAAQLEEPATVRALQALNEATRLRKLKPLGDLNAIGALLNHPAEPVRAATVRLIGTWKSGRFAPALLKIAGDAKSSASLRQTALTSLREIGGKEVIAGLRGLSAKERPEAIRRQAVLTLASLDLAHALPAIVEVLAATPREEEALDLWRALLSNKGAGEKLAAALSSGTLPEPVMRAGLRAAREGGRNEPQLVLALGRASGLHKEAEKLTPAEIQQMLAQVATSSDPARGEEIYRRPELGCVACHAIGGAGGKVGPDLTSIGASAPVDYLLESLISPNDKIKEGYHSILIETRDDQEFSGVLVRETEQELILRNAADQEISVAKSNVARKATGASLMPSGLIDQLSQQERVDLIRFMAELGKPGPYDASRAGVARSWKLLAGTHRIEQFGVDKIVGGDLQADAWQPVHTHVDGRLVQEQMLATTAVTRNIGLVSIYAATQFHAANAGRVRFTLPPGLAAPVWINGKSMSAGSQVEADVAAGQHVVIIRLDPKNMPEYLRLESPDVAFVN